MPTRRANLQGVSPDSFSSARYRCLSDSMNLLRMVPTCQLGRPGARWGWRSAYVEPVFANLQNKGMRRFTLRSRRKVNVQWQLFTMVHNIEKVAHAAWKS